MKVISVIAQKGGTGKTTLSLAIACAAAANHLSTAVIDLATVTAMADVVRAVAPTTHLLCVLNGVPSRGTR